MRHLIPIILATVIVHIPDGVVEEASQWFHRPQDSTESKAEYSTRRIFEFATPIASFGRFKTPEDAGITWEVKN